MSKDFTKEIRIKDLSFITDIKSIAIIGSSKKQDYFFLKNHAESFKETLYAVHPTVGEIPNFEKKNIFPTSEDIPGEVDFSFIVVPPSQILDVIVYV